MRPTKLVISAFGPYAETMPEIDFEQFEESATRAPERHTGNSTKRNGDACNSLDGVGHHRRVDIGVSRLGQASVEQKGHNNCRSQIVRSD